MRQSRPEANGCDLEEAVAELACLLGLLRIHVRLVCSWWVRSWGLHGWGLEGCPLGPLGSSSSQHRRTLELILQEGCCPPEARCAAPLRRLKAKVFSGSLYACERASSHARQVNHTSETTWCLGALRSVA